VPTLTNLGIVLAGLVVLASNAYALETASDQVRLDGSAGRLVSRPADMANANRTVSEPRDTYSDGA